MNNSRASLVVFYRSALAYLAMSLTKVRSRAGVGVGTYDITGVGVGVLLPLIEATLASSLLPMGKRFLWKPRQIGGPAIAMVEMSSKKVTWSLVVLLWNGLADPLGVKLLELQNGQSTTKLAWLRRDTQYKQKKSCIRHVIIPWFLNASKIALLEKCWRCVQ